MNTDGPVEITEAHWELLGFILSVFGSFSGMILGLYAVVFLGVWLYERLPEKRERL